MSITRLLFRNRAMSTAMPSASDPVLASATASVAFEKDNLWRRIRPFSLFPTSEQHCYDAETRILQLANVDIKRSFVPISAGNLNTYEMGAHFIEPEKQHLNKTMVMMPGFGAAIGLFYKNYEAFAKVPGLKVFAVDWLGTGRSSRVPFLIRPGKEGSVEAAENFFIDSLEEWREKQGIDKMILFGHSLGGYLSACYAMKYPDRVEHLLLVSPVGVPMKPEVTTGNSEARRRYPILFPIFRFFWEQSFTPHGLVRFSGHMGPSLVKWYTDRRFSYLEGEEGNVVRSYVYHYLARKASAEAALHCILDVGAWARNPLVNRVHNIKTPTTFYYGSHDWMDPKGGRAAQERMTVPTDLHIISMADHHLYLDNPEEFNRSVVEVLKNIQLGKIGKTGSAENEAN